jgi:hypothetical protein
MLGGFPLHPFSSSVTEFSQKRRVGWSGNGTLDDFQHQGHVLAFGAVAVLAACIENSRPL